MGQTAVISIELRGKADSLRAAMKGATKEFLSFSNTLKAGLGLGLGVKWRRGFSRFRATSKPASKAPFGSDPRFRI
jgi:hypothetical protein